MKKLTQTFAVLAAVTATVASPAAAADAAIRTDITFTDVRSFTGASEVTTSLDECPTATAVDDFANVAETSFGGVFVGVRDFQCEDGSGFVVRLTARFGDQGSTGSWSIIDSYGELEGLRGTGTLVGTPLDSDGDGEVDGISDVYSGTVTWTG